MQLAGAGARLAGAGARLAGAGGATGDCRGRSCRALEFGAFAILGIVLLISGTTPALAILLIVFWIGFGTYYVIVLRRQLRRVADLQRQLGPNPLK